MSKNVSSARHTGDMIAHRFRELPRYRPAYRWHSNTRVRRPIIRPFKSLATPTSGAIRNPPAGASELFIRTVALELILHRVRVISPPDALGEPSTMTSGSGFSSLQLIYIQHLQQRCPFGKLARLARRKTRFFGRIRAS